MEKKPVHKTEGEQAFEAYLASVGLAFGFEEKVPGTTKRPDYRVDLEGEPAYFEVKQSDPQPSDSHLGCGFFDPYRPVREKINAARKQLQGPKGASCSLVLYNNHTPLIFLDPPTVYGPCSGTRGSPSHSTPPPESATRVR